MLLPAGFVHNNPVTYAVINRDNGVETGEYVADQELKNRFERVEVNCK